MTIVEFNEALIDSNGEPLAGDYVTLYTTSAGTTEATLYTGLDGLTVASNPVRVNSGTDPFPGNLHFFAHAGTYYGRIENQTHLFPIVVYLSSQDLIDHTTASDPHLDRQYTRDRITAHAQAADPHLDRNYSDGQLAGHVAASNPSTDDAADPHHDRAYARAKISAHVSATDPHGDRAYTDSSLATHTALHNPHATHLGQLTDVDTSSAVDGQVLVRSGGTYTFGTVTSGGGGTVTSVPTGSLLPFAGPTAPTGYILCTGAAVSRTTYANLFAVIGTRYGAGDGSSTFNVPDMRARYPLGLASTGPTLAATSPGDSHYHATSGHALTQSEMPVHSHGINDPGHAHSVADPGHNHTVTTTRYATGSSGGYGTGDAVHANPSATWTSSTNGTGIGIYGSTTGISTQNAGSGASHDHGSVSTQGPLQPPYLCLNYIIAT